MSPSFRPKSCAQSYPAVDSIPFANKINKALSPGDPLFPHRLVGLFLIPTLEVVLSLISHLPNSLKFILSCALFCRILICWFLAAVDGKSHLFFSISLSNPSQCLKASKHSQRIDICSSGSHRIVCSEKFHIVSEFVIRYSFTDFPLG